MRSPSAVAVPDARVVSRIGELLETLAADRPERAGRLRPPRLDRRGCAVRRWFLAEAASLGLETEVDRNGNLWAHWRQRPGGGLVAGSHLDSVRNGGALDGPLGGRERVRGDPRAAGGGRDARLDRLRRRVRRRGGRPVRHRLPRLPPDDRRARPRSGPRAGRSRRRAPRRGDGAAGLDPLAIGPDPERVAAIAASVELHVEQGHLPVPARRRRARRRRRAARRALGIWPHGRWRIDVQARPTMPARRRWRIATTRWSAPAEVLVAARRRPRAGALATVGRVESCAGRRQRDRRAASALARRARRGRGADPPVVAQIADGGRRRTRSRRAGPTRSPPVDAALAAVVREVGAEAPSCPPAPATTPACSARRRATAMLSVRNPTGVSHAPGESPSRHRRGVSRRSPR